MGRREPSPPRARDNERTRPFGRFDRQVAPEDHLYEPGRPAKNPRYGEDTRLYRRLRVTSS
jgi:hypothetical protein